MTVNRYLFQSPSTNQVQIGRLDPSVKQENTSTDTSTSKQLDMPLAKSQTINPLERQGTNSSSDTILDVYA